MHAAFTHAVTLIPALPFPGHSHPRERGPLCPGRLPTCWLRGSFRTSCCRCSGVRRGRGAVLFVYGRPWLCDLAPNAAIKRPRSGPHAISPGLSPSPVALVLPPSPVPRGLCPSPTCPGLAVREWSRSFQGRNVEFGPGGICPRCAASVGLITSRTEGTVTGFLAGSEGQRAGPADTARGT